jgi:hypothetical protein
LGDGSAIAASERGESYVTGFLNGTATFGQGEPHHTTLTPAGEIDMFVAKYDRRGRLLWATQAGGAGSGFRVLGNGIATTQRGDGAHVTGSC